MGKLNRGQKLPAGRRPAWIVSIEVGPTTMHSDRRGFFPRLELQKGGYAWSWGRIVIGLDHMTRPHTKEVWTGKYARLCSKALISYGYKLPPLQSVRQYLDTPCSRKELRTW
jgi:hypothetical protein